MMYITKAKRFFISIFILFISIHSLIAQQRDWENEQVIGINKEAAHSAYIPYANIEQAMADYANESPFYQCLNGTWKFNWVKFPDLRPVSFFKPDFNVSYWDDIEVPILKRMVLDTMWAPLGMRSHRKKRMWIGSYQWSKPSKTILLSLSGHWGIKDQLI